MSDLLTKSLSSISFAAVLLASGAVSAAEPVSLDSMDSQQVRQTAQEQDQTQYRNRQKLEQRINGSGDTSSAAQNRNRYRHEEQTGKRTHSQAGGSQSPYYSGAGAVSGGRGSGQGASGPRMSGAGGGGRR